MDDHIEDLYFIWRRDCRKWEIDYLWIRDLERAGLQLWEQKVSDCKSRLYYYTQEKEQYMRTGYYLGSMYCRDIFKRKGFWDDYMEDTHKELVSIVARRLEHWEGVVKRFKPLAKQANTIDIEAIKRIPILEVCRYLGIPDAKGGFIYSPYHKEKTPSCKIYLNTNTYYDYSMGKGGSVIDLVMAVNSVGLREAIEYLDSLT